MKKADVGIVRHRVGVLKLALHVGFMFVRQVIDDVALFVNLAALNECRFAGMPLAACAILWAQKPGLAGDWVKAKLDAASRQYCHEVRFPLGWQILDLIGTRTVPKYDFQNGGHEFRVLDPPRKVLVRGYIPFFDNRDYTTNLNSVDLSDTAGVAQPASEVEWNSARPVQPESRNGDEIRKYLKSLGFPVTASGDHQEGGSLSPDQAVFFRFSWKGNLGSCGGNNDPFGLSPRLFCRSAHGKLFFDAYSTSSGKKLVTVIANFSVILPEEVKTGWVTGRYFFIPLDDKRIRCLVCEFGNTR